MKTYRLDPERPHYRALAEIADTVKKGGVVIYPTDTIYGMGCDVYQAKAVKKIEAAKDRERGKPFSFICRDLSQISEFAFVPNWAFRAMTKVLPGPYTFILEARRTNLPKKLVGNRNTVGVRIPANPICATLAELVGAPLVSTSVNVAGADHLSEIEKIPASFTPYVDAIIDVGPLFGEPSTVIDATGAAPILLRQGAGPVDF